MFNGTPSQESMLKMNLQLFAEGDPIANPTLAPVDPTPTDPTPPQDPGPVDPTPAPDLPKLKVKFNHEEKELPYEEAVLLAQKGMNYDKAVERARQEAKDTWISQQGYEWNGKPIRTEAEYNQAITEQQESQRRESLQKQGIDPKIVDEYVNNNPIVKKAGEIISQQEQQAKFQSEASEFFEMFPDVDAKTIDPKVFQLKAEKGLSLTDAYLRVNFSTLKAKSEQEVIAKMQANSQSSPGSLSQGATQQTNSVSSMSKSDFAKLQEQVLRGERKQI